MTTPIVRRWRNRLLMPALVFAQIVVGIAINILTTAWNWLVLSILLATALGWAVLEARRSQAVVEPEKADRQRPSRPAIDSLVPPWGLRPMKIRGRDDIIDVLDRLAVSSDGRAHVLHGMGGSGKTAIALEICARAKERGQPTWWLRVPDKAPPEATLLALLGATGTDTPNIETVLSNPQHLADLAWTRLDRTTGWVLVFDNVDIPEVLTVGRTRVRDGNGVIRATGAGLVLVTSRQGDRQLWGDGAALHQVDVLGDTDGAQVLLDNAGNGAGTDVEAAALSKRLGGLPLGLRAAGSYLASTRAALDGVSTFTDYAHALETRFGRTYSEVL
jgi:hypothetical protein